MRQHAGLMVALFLAALALRVPFRTTLAYHWDCAEFALAVREYNIALSQPHAPGYFLYVMLGRLVNVVDATATRVMGLYPERIGYLNMMLPHGGTINAGRIRQLGEDVAQVRRDFRVLPHLAWLKQPSPWANLLRGL